jgi:hypothetical protein
VGVSREKYRRILLVGLLVAALFAAWSWLRPYAWGSDPAARCRVSACKVTRDLSFYWLEVHLKMRPGESHDLMKPVSLVTEDGREIEPADTTLAGDKRHGTTDLWFKFWLEPAHIEQPLKLHINDGNLVIRSNHGRLRLGSSNVEIFNSPRW